MEGLRDILAALIDRGLRIIGVIALVAIAALLAWIWWKFG